MASDFEMATLSDVASINPRRRVQKGASVPFIEMAALPTDGRDIPVPNLQTRIAKGSGSHFQNGDTLLARITPCLENGKTAQVSNLPEDTVGEGSTEFIVLCGAEPEDNDFVYYVSRSPEFRDFAISRMEGTTGRQRVAWRSLADYRMSLPPPSARREGAKILRALDDRIETLREANNTLEAIAQALFKSWFVNFDPVHAKAEGREPEGMDAATAALFPSEFEDSELGSIPKGWQIEAFACAFDFTMGQSPPGSTYNTDHVGTPFFQGCTDFGDVFPASRVFTTAPSRFAKEGDVLMSVRAPVGAVNLAGSDCAIGRGLCAIRHKSGSTGLTIEFVKACIQRIEAAAGEGALFKSLSKRQLADLQVVSASDALVIAAIEHLEPIVKRRLLLARQADALTQLRDTLLPGLISGKIKDVQAQEKPTEGE